MMITEKERYLMKHNRELEREIELLKEDMERLKRCYAVTSDSWKNQIREITELKKEIQHLREEINSVRNNL